MKSLGTYYSSATKRLSAMSSSSAHWLGQIPHPDASDVLMVAGLASVCYALWQIWVPLAWLFGGIVLFLFGVILGRPEKKGR